MSLNLTVNVADRIRIGDADVWFLGAPGERGVRVRVDGPDGTKVRSSIVGIGWATPSEEIVLGPRERAIVGDAQFWYEGSPDSRTITVSVDAPRSVPIHCATQGRGHCAGHKNAKAQPRG